MTQEKLNKALNSQIIYELKIREAHIARAYINLQQINDAHHFSAKIIVGLLLMSFGASYPFIPRCEAAGNKSSAAQVTARVLQKARMKVNYQASQINITAKDIAQGYVYVMAASRFTVAAIRGTTYFIDVNPRSRIFTSVIIEGLGSQVVLGGEGGSIKQSRKGKKSPENVLNYRFILKAKLQPGMYAWPLQLAVRV
jgi:hypothetical protein